MHYLVGIKINNMNQKVIKCETINIYRNKKTGKTYETKEDYLKENSEEDLAVDLTVKVPTLDLFGETQ